MSVTDLTGTGPGLTAHHQQGSLNQLSPPPNQEAARPQLYIHLNGRIIMGPSETQDTTSHWLLSSVDRTLASGALSFLTGHGVT